MRIIADVYGNVFCEYQTDSVSSLVRLSHSHPVIGAIQEAAIQDPELHMALPKIPSRNCVCVKLW